VTGRMSLRRRVHERFGARLALTLFVAVPAAALAGLLAVAVESAWDPFRQLDERTASYLHDQATGHPLVIKILLRISDYGGPAPARVLVALVAVVLWIRGAHRLALWAASTMIAGAVLDTGLKTLVDRARPHLPHPFAHAPGASFPSGHAMASALACGIVVLVLLPVLNRAGKAAAWTIAALAVFAVGYSRVALGVHWVTDVVGAWLLAVALLAASVSAFQTWRVEHGLRRARPVTEGVEPEEAEIVLPPEHKHGHGHGREHGHEHDGGRP
jgi:membrane-associated phospholipid phosphatase